MRLPIFIAITLTLAFAPALHSRIINVPDDFQTIQTAIDDAAVDAIDTILIADGVYTGDGNINLTISREMVITSVNGALETIIDCEESADSRAIFATANVTIIGLTLTNATSNGLRVDNAQRLLIDGCRFIANAGVVAQQSGGGIQLRTCVGTIKNSIFAGNSNIGSGGGMVINTSTISIEGCLFENNHADRFGGAVLVTNNSNIRFFNNLFTVNTAGIDGGAIAHSLASQSQISFCTFLENEAVGMGGAIYKGSNSNPNVINSIFWGNRAEIGNQLAAQDNGGEITIAYCIAEGGVDDVGRWNGENIIDQNPVLIDGREPAWGWNGYYLNQDESPAIDAGSGSAEELGVDNLFTAPDLSSDIDEADLGFHYWIGWFNIFGRLSGRVLDLTDDSPISDAVLTTTLGQSAISDEEGNWEIARARIGRFDLTTSKDYYTTVVTVDQELGEDEELEQIIRLPHPEFRLSVEELTGELGIDDTAATSFNVINDGNGALTWTSYLKLNDEDNVEPWTSIRTFQVGNAVEDTRVTGVAYDGEFYYVSGADGDEPSKIYVLDSDGAPVREFLQPGSARFGMRDLAWDGELLWGTSNGDVIGFTIDGDSVTSFQGPVDPTYAVTYDSEREIYWASAITSDIFGYDREGNLVSQINRGVMRIYGLAYWENDPDNATLYIHGNSADDPSAQIFKIDPDGQIIGVALLELPANSNAEGVEIVNSLDPYAAIMLAFYNHPDGDFINFWRVDRRDSWLAFEPESGVVEGGASEEVILTITSMDFLEGHYRAEAHFQFNAMGDSMTVPISMEVSEGDVAAVRSIPLPMGWSLVSSHIRPDAPDIRVIMQPLVDSGQLMFMKDTEGRIYAPLLDEPFFDMEPWEVSKPYWIKMRSPAILRLEGLTVRSDTPLPLQEGWNGIAYYPRVIMDPVRAFAEIVESIELVRDGEGRFYLPRYNFNNLPSCRHGNGYLVRVNRDIEFVWGGAPEGDFVQTPTPLPGQPEYFDIPEPTGFTMSLLALAPGQDGAEIAVFCGEKIVGGGVISGGMSGIAIVSDDPTTTAVEGAIPGEELIIKRYDGNGIETLSSKIVEGNLIYLNDGLTVIELAENVVPQTALLIDAYPNPFNSSTSVRVELPQTGEVTVALFDIQGRIITDVFSGVMTAGNHQFNIDGGSLSSGLYFLKVKTPDKQASTRLLLLR